MLWMCSCDSSWMCPTGIPSGIPGRTRHRRRRWQVWQGRRWRACRMIAVARWICAQHFFARWICAVDLRVCSCARSLLRSHLIKHFVEKVATRTRALSAVPGRTPTVICSASSHQVYAYSHSHGDSRRVVNNVNTGSNTHSPQVKKRHTDTDLFSAFCILHLLFASSSMTHACDT